MRLKLSWELVEKHKFSKRNTYKIQFMCRVCRPFWKTIFSNTVCSSRVHVWERMSQLVDSWSVKSACSARPTSITGGMILIVETAGSDQPSPQSRYPALYEQPAERTAIRTASVVQQTHPLFFSVSISPPAQDIPSFKHTHTHTHTHRVLALQERCQGDRRLVSTLQASPLLNICCTSINKHIQW